MLRDCCSKIPQTNLHIRFLSLTIIVLPLSRGLVRVSISLSGAASSIGLTVDHYDDPEYSMNPNPADSRSLCVCIFTWMLIRHLCNFLKSQTTN